jgi:uncharacterized protein YceH (UPF0502 family)
MRNLSLLEARVVAVLAEKAHTVPDSYPLSMNSLVAGCNQKSARDPVLNASDDEVQAAIDSLKALHLVFESSGSRVSRYEHNLGRTLGVPSQAVALLAVLMLRGPQTASELRGNAERLHKFADTSSAEGFLEELAARSEEKGGPLAVLLPRAPGAREARWAHLLCGEIDVSAMPVASDTADFVAASELAAMKAQQVQMQQEIDSLKGLVDRLYTELGISKT